METDTGGRLGRTRSPWGVAQFLGVCTCFVGFRTFSVFPTKLQTLTAAYFLPYYIGLVTIVLPALYVQLKLGGTTQRNIVSLFSRFSPILKGIGIACVIRMFIFNIYFNVIASYALFYSYSSLYNPFPWSYCNNEWNNQYCQFENQTDSVGFVRGMPELQYFENYALRISRGISEEGAIPWHMGVALLVAWVVTFGLIGGGMRYFGWAVTVTGGTAMVISVAVLAYGHEEVDHGFYPGGPYTADWAILTKPSPIASFLSIWLDGILEGATISLLWHGVLPSVGKYGCHGRVRSNVMWLALFLFLCIIPHIIVTTLLTYLSALSRTAGIPPQDITASSIRTIFVMMPAAFSSLEIRKPLAVVFFLVVFLFCANTQGLVAATAIDNLDDGTKYSIRKYCKRKIVRIVLISSVYCALGLVLSVPYITQGGIYLVTLVELWIDRLICFVVFFSMIAYTETYAKQTFRRFNRIVILSWFVLASLFTTAASIYTARFHKEPRKTRSYIRHGVDYAYPEWANVIGWLIASGPIIIGLLYGVVHAFTAAEGRGITRFVTACTGSSDIGPDDSHRKFPRDFSASASTRTFSEDAAAEYMKPSPF